MNRKPRLTLDNLVQHFYQLYGGSNELYHSDLVRLVGYLVIAARELEHSIFRPDRVDVNPKQAMASLFGWWTANIGYFRGRFCGQEIDHWVATKYRRVCPYCREKVCRCVAGRNRPEPMLRRLVGRVRRKSLAEWQVYFHRRYGAANKQFDMQQLISNLNAEIAELMILALIKEHWRLPVNEFKKRFALECGDVLARLCAIATRLGCDLEREVLKRYRKRCRKCKVIPCKCYALVLARGRQKRGSRSRILMAGEK